MRQHHAVLLHCLQLNKAKMREQEQIKAHHRKHNELVDKFHDIKENLENQEKYNTYDLANLHAKKTRVEKKEYKKEERRNRSRYKRS